MRITERQREVLEQFCKGLQNKEVAHALGISTRMVEIHRADLMAATRSHTAVQLGIWAERHGYTGSKPPATPPARDAAVMVHAAAAGGAV